MFISVKSMQKHIMSKRNSLENAVIFYREADVLCEAGANFFFLSYTDATVTCQVEM